VTATSDRAEQLAAFYARHAERLQRTVRAKVRSACAQTIEDACQTAWATLVRRDDITLDERGARWLATVAIHEGWRLTTGSGAVPMGAMRAGAAEEGELPEPPATAPPADAQALAASSTPSCSPTCARSRPTSDATCTCRRSATATARSPAPPAPATRASTGG
jgi:DNA-directed RNA polymerase specialized sigma24 family protein